MQFVTKGPEVPEELLRAHEDGNVVFFCGAGVSSPAKLPEFEKLVYELYKKVGDLPDEQQANAIKEGAFDRAIYLLERSRAGGRSAVRKYLPEILCPDHLNGKTTFTHKALLSLGQTKDGKVRIVTTNFDRLFEKAISETELVIERYKAPLLPVPKNNWNGLVYLHGLLSTKPSSDELNQLILSSGDFGRAYLTERWAARFVTELFSRYTVCFIGYSIEDPVLRYLMDAFAADLLEGESNPRAYAFVGCNEGEEDKISSEWDAKNVIPILYNKKNDHNSLHTTLKEWAECYRDGILGKERIVVKYAHSKPLLSTREDNFVDRMLWALSDPSGLPMGCFADLNPPPPIEWLEEFVKKRFQFNDLHRFGIDPKGFEKSIEFSLIHRIVTAQYNPWMSPVYSNQNASCRLDPILQHICRWLVRHLESPQLIFWVAQQGGYLQSEFAQMIEKFLGENLELPENVKKLWDLILVGKVGYPDTDFAFVHWVNPYRKYRLTFPSQLQLRKLLTPKIQINTGSRNGLSNETDPAQHQIRLNDWMSFQIVLGIPEPHYLLSLLAKDPNWAADLPLLLDDASSLLLDSLNLMKELGKINERQDLSYISHQPLIRKSPQNHGYQDWTALLELTRDAWIETARSNPEKALLVTQHWISLPYSIFKRLAFFAATHLEVVNPTLGLKWLLKDDAWWLWSDETRPEALRLLISIAPKLTKTSWNTLEKHILRGPPESMFHQNLTEDKLKRIREADVSVKLAKAQHAGASLGKKAKATLKKILEKYPNFNPLDESDEFSFRMESGAGSLFGNQQVPRKLDELTNWLTQHPVQLEWRPDDWKDLCTDEMSLALTAIEKLAHKDLWLRDRWREALSSWTCSELAVKSWPSVTKMLASASDEFIHSISHPLSWWLEEVAKSVSLENMVVEDAIFVARIGRILEVHAKEKVSQTNDPVHTAINHSLGITAKAALIWIYKQQPKDGDGIKHPIKEILTKMCDTEFESFRYARLELATNVVTLFRLDPEWSKENLLPLFDWDRSTIEAANAWMGFLTGPRQYYPLFKEMKESFLATALYTQSLGKYADSYASLLTWVAINPSDSFTKVELAQATQHIGQTGLVTAQKTLLHFLRSFSEEQKSYRKDDFWKNRVKPYFESIWPKQKKLTSGDEISDNFAELCLQTNEQFPDAYDMIGSWLKRTNSCGSVIRHLRKSGLCSKFPDESLKFLGNLVNDNLSHGSSYLEESLIEIEKSNALLKENREFKRLTELVYKLKAKRQQH